MTLVIEADPIPLQVDVDGEARVGGTRVTLDTVVGAFEDGATAEEIALRYPAVRLADIYAVIGYYLRHQDAVRGYLEERHALETQVRREIESRSDVAGIRERLLARHAVERAG